MNEPLNLIFKPGPDEDASTSLEQGKATHNGGLFLEEVGGSSCSKATPSSRVAIDQFAGGRTNRGGGVPNQMRRYRKPREM